MGSYLSSFIYTNYASVHNKKQGDSIRNSQVDTKEVPTSYLLRCSPIPMDAREVEWSDDGLESTPKRKFLQSSVSGSSETLGRQNKKRKFEGEAYMSPDASTYLK